MTLTEFLLARIAEDEAAARSLGDEPGRRWLHSLRGVTDQDARRFGARANPTRVLAECEAKRRIVERAEIAHERAKVGPSDGDSAWFLAVRYLALPYADHPDFREEWRP